VDIHTTIRSRVAAVAVAAAVALPALFLTAVPVAAVNCTTSHCATLNLVFATNLGNPGYGLVTSSDGVLSCFESAGPASGTCTDKVAWSLASGSTTITLTGSPHTGSQACYSHDGANLACSTLGQNYVLHVTLLPNMSASPIFVFLLSRDTLVVSMTGTGTGVVKANGVVVSCAGGACGKDYNYGDVLQFTTSASKGSFTKWGHDCAGQGATCTLTMTTQHFVSAEFDVAATPAPTPTAPTGPRPTRNDGSAGGTSGAQSSPGASGSAGQEVLGATAGSSESDLGLLSTSAPSAADGAPASPAASSNSDGLPWIPIILVVALLVGGVNLAIFQVTRSRRPPA